MRMGSTRAGRAALGAAAAVGVQAHGAPLHRRRGRRRRRAASCAASGSDGVASSVDLLGEATVTAAEADRYAARCAAALDDLAGVYDGLAPAPLLERDAAGPDAAGQPLGQGLRADAAAAARRARPRPARRRRAPAPAAAPGARRAARTCTSTWSSLDSREAVTDLVLELLAEDEFRDGPVGRASSCRPTCATRRRSLDAAARLGARATRARTPLTVRLVKGAYWDHEIVEARQHGWTPPVFEDKADSDRNFEALTRAPARRAPPASGARRDRLAQPALGRARDRRQPARSAAATGGPRAPGPARPRRRPRSTRSPATGLPRAHLLPGRRPRRGDGLPRAAAAGEHEQRLLPARPGHAACRSRSCWRRREPRCRRSPTSRSLELRRGAAARRACSTALAALDAQPAAARPGLDRRRPPRRRGARRRPTPATPSRVVATSRRATAAEVDARRRRRRASGFARVGRAPGGRARRGARCAPRDLLRERRPRARRARGARVREAVGRGRRRRLRGDRLPRVLRARRDRRSTSRRRRCSSSPGERNAMRYAPARRRAR